MENTYEAVRKLYDVAREYRSAASEATTLETREKYFEEAEILESKAAFIEEQLGELEKISREITAAVTERKIRKTKINDALHPSPN